MLEIGCGTGANLDYYDWTKVESLDLTEPDPHMARRARTKALAAPAGVVSVHEAPAEALPFGAETFDTVVCTLVLCTVGEPAQALSEVRRVLKPQGTLRLVEHVRAAGRWARLQDFVQPVYGWLAAGCVLGRNTELTLAAAGFRLEVDQRLSFGPPMPGFSGVAHKE